VSAGREAPAETVEADVGFDVFFKSAPVDHVIYGWAYVSKDERGRQVVDHSGEAITIEELRKGAHFFLRESREADDMHEGDPIGAVVESLVVTDDLVKALPNVFVQGEGPRGWLVGIDASPEIHGKIKVGERLMLSIAGKANVVEDEE